MKSRATIVVLASILIGLVVLFLYGVVADRGRTGVQTLAREAGLSDVSEIEISGPAGISRLRKGPSGWTAEQGGYEFPARDQRISLLLDSVRGAEIVRSVTADRALWSRFGVGDGATRMRFSSSSAQLAVVVGAETEADGVYLRLEDGPEVYEVDASLSFFAEQRLAFWLLLRLLPEDVSPDEVIAVRSWAIGALIEAGAPGTTSIVRNTGFDRPEAFVVRQRGATALDFSLPRRTGLEAIASVVNMVGASFWLGEWDELSLAGGIDVELSDGRSFSLEIRGTGPFVVEPSGPNLPGEAFGGLRYAIDSARLVRAIDVAGSR